MFGEPGFTASGIDLTSVVQDQITADADLAREASYPFDGTRPLTHTEREELRRRVAAKRDTAMLGGSGYERIEADFYPTPPENVDVLLSHFVPNGLIWEPACGDGAISKRLMWFGYDTWSSDLHDQGWGTPGMDFLAHQQTPNLARCIITNPPYAATAEHPEGLAEAFVRHALEVTRPVKGQVAMFLRNEFDCSKGRMDLFGLPPFHMKIVVTKRPRWIAGSTGSPRHNYAWFIWDWRHIKGPGAVVYAHPSKAAPISNTSGVQRNRDFLASKN